MLAALLRAIEPLNDPKLKQQLQETDARLRQWEHHPKISTPDGKALFVALKNSVGEIEKLNKLPPTEKLKQLNSGTFKKDFALFSLIIKKMERFFDSAAKAPAANDVKGKVAQSLASTSLDRLILKSETLPAVPRDPIPAPNAAALSGMKASSNTSHKGQPLLPGMKTSPAKPSAPRALPVKNEKLSLPGIKFTAAKESKESRKHQFVDKCMGMASQFLAMAKTATPAQQNQNPQRVGADLAGNVTATLLTGLFSSIFNQSFKNDPARRAQMEEITKNLGEAFSQFMQPQSSSGQPALVKKLLTGIFSHVFTQLYKNDPDCQEKIEELTKNMEEAFNHFVQSQKPSSDDDSSDDDNDDDNDEGKDKEKGKDKRKGKDKKDDPVLTSTTSTFTPQANLARGKQPAAPAIVINVYLQPPKP